MTSYEFETYPAARLSDAERERVVEVLRENAVEGRLSHDTFLRRMELVFSARGHDELDALTADLPDHRSEGRLTRLVVRTVGRVSAFNVRVGRAWRAERLAPLLLPEPARYPLRIGRAPESGLRLADASVSRIHAELRREGELWILRDLGSTNGSCVNGRRVTGATAVRPGDQVSFGNVAFRLAVPSGR